MYGNSSTGEATMKGFFEKAFWLLIAGIAALGVKLLGDISANIAMLNVKMETVVQQITTQKAINSDHEFRIRILEKGEI